MRGLMPRSLPSLFPCNADRSSGTLCSSVCGGPRRLSPGRLCCSSKRYLAKSSLVAVVGFVLAAAYPWVPAVVVPSVSGLQ